MNVDALLIDGRNNVYRAVFAGLASGIRSGHVSILLRCINKYLRNYRPKTVAIMWDYNGVIWRTRIYPQYKATRGADSAKHIERFGVDPVDLVRETVETGTKLFKSFGFGQYETKFQEADDLIFSYCDVYKDQNILIISSDGDLLQIPYSNKNVKVLSPNKDAIMPIPDVDPVLIKCLQGDKSDNISGFKGIGPVKAKKLASDPEKLKAFLDEGDGSRWNYYNIYQKIIGLHNNPFKSMNNKYIEENVKISNFDMKLAVEVIRESKTPTLFDDVRITQKLLSTCTRD